MGFSSRQSDPPSSGLRVPRDISLAAYGSIAGAELMYTRPSIVTLDPREIAGLVLAGAGTLIVQIRRARC